MSIKSILRCASLVLAASVLASACTAEEYGPCSIPNTRSHKAACQANDSTKRPTCRAEYVFDCDSLICGIYSGSDPFCTRRCIPSDEICNKSYPDNPEFCKCPNGKDCVQSCPENAACLEWTKGSSEFFCLPAKHSNGLVSE